MQQYKWFNAKWILNNSFLLNTFSHKTFNWIVIHHPWKIISKIVRNLSSNKMFWISELKKYRWHTRLILMTDKCCICKTQYNTKQFLKCIDVWNRNPNRIQGFLSLIFSCIYWNTEKTTIPTLFSCTLRIFHFLNLYYVKYSQIKYIFLLKRSDDIIIHIT